MGYQVYITYAEEDHRIANMVQEKIEELGFNACTTDALLQMIEGANLEEAPEPEVMTSWIEASIEAAFVLIVILTQKTITAQRVTGEIKTARRLMIDVVHLLFDDTNLAFNIERAAGLRFSDPGAYPWNELKDQLDDLKKVAIEQAMATLESNSESERTVRAIDTLGHLRFEPAIPGIIESSHSKTLSIRRAAITALGILRVKEAVPEFINALGDDYTDVHFAAIGALSNIGSDSIPGLLEALKNANAAIRRSAISILEQTVDNAVLARIVEMLKDENWQVRVAAAHTLARKRFVPAIPHLVQALEDEDWQVRQAMVFAFQEMGETAVHPLLEVLSSSNKHVREGATRALGFIQSHEAVPKILEKLYDPDIEVRRAAVHALGVIADATAVPDLLKMLDDSDDYIRGNAAYDLGKINSTIAVPALLEKLGDSQFEMRCAAAQALGMMKSVVAVEALLHLLRDKVSDVRITTANALGEISDSKAVPSLIELLSDNGRSERWPTGTMPVCEVAAHALERIGTPEALESVALWQREQGNNSYTE